MKYIRPFPASVPWRVTSDYSDHANRKPPSVEPGTDYGLNHGTPIIAIAPGTVTAVKSTSSGAMGRFVTLYHGNGHYSRVLHLSQTRVYVGQRVNQGDVVGLSGGSAWGREDGVSAHVHLSFWAGFHTREPVACSDKPSPFGDFLGTPVPNNVVQRRAAVFTNRRSQPTTRSNILPDGLEAGVVGNFNGYIVGETVEGNSVWFRGISGNWFWSGGFVGGSDTSGMTDLGAW